MSLKDGIPAPILRHDEGPTELRNLAALAETYSTDTRDAHASLIISELQRAITMWKFDLVPASRGFEPRIAGCFAALDASKERCKCEIEPMHHCILAIAVDGRKARFADP